MYGAPQPSPQEFKNLLDRTKKASFAENKLSEVALAVRGGFRVTSEQGGELIHAIHGDKEQQQGALLLYPSCVDPANFGAALRFTFRNERSKVIKQLLQMQCMPLPFQGPMDSHCFDLLMKRLKNDCSFAEDKLAEVRLALHGGAFFNSDQAGKMIKLIHGDKEQISAATELYPRVVDSGGFGSALSNMTFSSSKDTVMKAISQIPPFNGGGGGGFAAPPPSHGAGGGYAPPSTQAQQYHHQQPGYGYGGHGYGGPQQPGFSGFGAPQPGHPGFGQPGFGYGGPQPGFGGPQPGFGGPQPGFGAPMQQNYAPQPMDDNSFSGLEKRMGHGFASDKKQEVLLALQGGAYFTSAQAKKLLKIIHGDSEQIEAAVALYHRVLDRQNFGDALTSMTFSSSKAKVLEKIK